MSPHSPRSSHPLWIPNTEQNLLSVITLALLVFLWWRSNFLDLNGEIKKYNPKTEYFKTNRRELMSLWGWSLFLCIVGKMWLSSHIDLFHSAIFLPGPAGICIQVPFFSAEKHSGTSLVVWGIWICLPMQGTWIQSLVWEDSIGN